MRETLHKSHAIVNDLFQPKCGSVVGHSIELWTKRLLALSTSTKNESCAENWFRVSQRARYLLQIIYTPGGVISSGAFEGPDFFLPRHTGVSVVSRFPHFPHRSTQRPPIHIDLLILLVGSPREYGVASESLKPLVDVLRSMQVFRPDPVRTSPEKNTIESLEYRQSNCELYC